MVRLLTALNEHCLAVGITDSSAGSSLAAHVHLAALELESFIDCAESARCALLCLVQPDASLVLPNMHAMHGQQGQGQ
jgi:hypothetical protein